ncbi:hypothetical protein [Leeuwenhoekiella marinoflava]|uniref:hypothetical protein n=1 Tax=Leeuwenhoekiella marinoflava TaxID=988 RepID=UPI0030033EDD
MKKFELDFCDECSSWEPNVVCKKFSKQYLINVTFCFTEEKYTLNCTAMEDGCEERDTINLPKEEMETYLEENFELLSDFECKPFSEVIEICPTCNESEEPGLSEL